MTMQLYDTAKREIVPFDPNLTVTMYTCGITPYDSAHIGHGAVYLYYDVVVRRLRDLGHIVQLVRNVTDVDDDMLAHARQKGVNYQQLATQEMAKFTEAMDALNLLRPYSEPMASSAIPDILGFIGMVLDRGFAYESGGNVYFSVKAFDTFGELSHYTREEMLLFAAERGGHTDDVNKIDPLDFVLWQKSAEDEPSWDSLWGPGRPGWHVECSALALRELGTTIDLHGGGADLIFPHHESERAQSQAATGEPFVRHWMHVGMVRYEGEKMSKSLGNLVFVHELLAKTEPDAIRAAILANHYRGGWCWSNDLIDEAQARLKRWTSARVGDSPHVTDRVRAALDADLDTPQALDVLDEAVEADEPIGDAARLLGFRFAEPS